MHSFQDLKTNWILIWCSKTSLPQGVSLLTLPVWWPGTSPGGTQRSWRPWPHRWGWTSSPGTSRSGWSCRWWRCRRSRRPPAGGSPGGSSPVACGCWPVTGRHTDKQINKQIKKQNIFFFVNMNRNINMIFSYGIQLLACQSHTHRQINKQNIFLRECKQNYHLFMTVAQQ